MIGSIILGALHAWRDHKHNQQQHTQENTTMSTNLIPKKASDLNIGDRFKTSEWNSVPWRTVTHKSKDHIIGERDASIHTDTNRERVVRLDEFVWVEDVGHQPPQDPCARPAEGSDITFACLRVGDRFSWKDKDFASSTYEVTRVENGRVYFKAEGSGVDYYRTTTNDSKLVLLGPAPATTTPTWRVGQRVTLKNTTTSGEIVFVGAERVMVRWSDNHESSYALANAHHYLVPAKPVVRVSSDRQWRAWTLDARGKHSGSIVKATKEEAMTFIAGTPADRCGISYTALDGTVTYFDRNGDPADVAKP